MEFASIDCNKRFHEALEEYLIVCTRHIRGEEPENGDEETLIRLISVIDGHQAEQVSFYSRIHKVRQGMLMPLYDEYEDAKRLIEEATDSEDDLGDDPGASSDK